MSFTRWSVAIAWLVMFGLVGVATFAGVGRVALLLLVAAALAVPALILRDSADHS
ncbi:MAG TPA: hypothetical protein VFA59_22005 [Vicinamibacterales bacterium]|nr:hypothetical protein [Vicinamibacterales bacterium]